MTAHPRPPHDEDDDLDLRALYRTLPRAEPDAALDTAVREAAARAVTADRRVQRQRRLWHPGWGVAASIVLTACLFLLTDFNEPDNLAPKEAPPVNAELASPPQTVQRAAPQADSAAALRRYAPAPQAERAMPAEILPAPASPAPQYRARPESPALADTQRPGAGAGTVPAEAETDARVARIRALLREGRRDEAVRALQDLRTDAPALELPDDLRAILPPAP